MNSNRFLIKNPKPYECQKNKKLALNSGKQTNQILSNDDEVCIPRLSSVFLAVPQMRESPLDNLTADSL